MNEVDFEICLYEKICDLVNYKYGGEFTEENIDDCVEKIIDVLNGVKQDVIIDYVKEEEW